jgi:hypothetical protein
MRESQSKVEGLSNNERSVFIDNVPQIRANAYTGSFPQTLPIVSQMNRHFTSFYCEYCRQLRRFTKRCVDHPRHLMATILTCGLWGIAWWILHRQDAQRAWRCCMCGTHQTPKEEPAEARALRERRRSVSMSAVASRRVY